MFNQRNRSPEDINSNVSSRKHQSISTQVKPLKICNKLTSLDGIASSGQVIGSLGSDTYHTVNDRQSDSNHAGQISHRTTFPDTPDISWRITTFPDVSWQFLTCQVIFLRHRLTLPDASWRILTFPDASWHFLTYPYASWIFPDALRHFLTYRDSSWRVSWYFLNTDWHCLTLPDASWHFLTYPDDFLTISWRVIWRVWLLPTDYIEIERLTKSYHFCYLIIHIPHSFSIIRW
jgi:hypothetical protein